VRVCVALIEAKREKTDEHEEEKANLFYVPQYCRERGKEDMQKQVPRQFL